MKIAVVGGVSSTKLVIEKLYSFGFETTHIWGYEPIHHKDVSGWTDLRETAKIFGLGYTGFRKVANISDQMSNFAPDVLFAVGISQILPAEMLRIAKMINIGFHPTALPKGRGRAPMAWIILDGVPAAATFFELGLGADDGAILAQVPFSIGDEDDAAIVEKKLLEAEGLALDALLPMLRDGQLSRQEQDHLDASWYGRRTPDDGLIDWREDANEIVRLIRASASPHPGAFTFSGDDKVLVLRASVVGLEIKGVVGSILAIEEHGFIVQTGNGLVLVSKWSSGSTFYPKVGMRLGYLYDVEIFELRRQVAELSSALATVMDQGRTQ